jgi:hypothetical protein
MLLKKAKPPRMPDAIGLKLKKENRSNIFKK